MNRSVCAHRSTAEGIQVFDGAPVDLRARRSQFLGGRIGAGEPEHLMACANEFLHDGRADEAGGTGDEYFHGLILVLCRLTTPMYPLQTIVATVTLLQSSVASVTLPSMKEVSRPYHHGHLREALLAVAERALEAGGVQSFSLRELSRELGVSHTSPRRHFADKQALLDALAVRGFERFDKVLGKAAAKRGLDFRTRLTGMAHAYVGFAVKHPALLNLMYDAKRRPDAPRELVAASEKAFAHTPATFAEGQATGEVVPGDPALLTLMVVSALLGLITISTDGKFKGKPLLHLTDEFIDRLILGFCPRPT